MKIFFTRLVKYLTEDIWRIQKFELTKPHVVLINIIRIIFLSVKGFILDKCSQKASALTYYSLLSVVPILALVFGIAKGFGVDGVIQKQLVNSFAGQEEVLKYILNFSKSYLSKSTGGMFIGFGLLLLFWSVMRVMVNIEESFNDIWEVKRSRSFVRKFSDYIAILFLVILFLLSSGSMVMYVTAKLFDYETLWFMRTFLSMLLPYLLVSFMFILLIIIMPNTKVNFTSALIGGLISGLLFQLSQYYFINFMFGVSRYNAVYGSFAALPLFMIWMQVSWLIILFGAELAFSIQNVKSFEFEVETKNVSIEYKRVVAIVISYCIVKRFEKGLPAQSAYQISINQKLPIRLVNEIIFELVHSGVIVELNDYDKKGNVAFQPAMDINKIKVSHIIDKIEKRGSKNIHIEETKELSHIREIVENLKQSRDKSDYNTLVKDINLSLI